MGSVKALAEGRFRTEQVGCPHCAELQGKVNELNCERSYWQSMHAKAVEREQKLKAEVEQLKAVERRPGKTDDY